MVGNEAGQLDDNRPSQLAINEGGVNLPAATTHAAPNNSRRLISDIFPLVRSIRYSAVSMRSSIATAKWESAPPLTPVP
jgi:hypothetical protein